MLFGQKSTKTTKITSHDLFKFCTVADCSLQANVKEEILILILKKSTEIIGNDQQLGSCVCSC